jgi:hypothetical protein
VLSHDADAELRRLANQSTFRHRDAAKRALSFRASGDVSDLLAVLDDPHPCGMIEVLFALAGSKRPWLNWVPMPSESVCRSANYLGGLKAQGQQVVVRTSAMSSWEPASAITASRRVLGPSDLQMLDTAGSDIRVPIRPGRYAVWRYDGIEPVPAVPAPSPRAVEILHAAGDEAWPSMLSGYLQAQPLGELPLDDLLGLLAHLPGPPDTPRWRHLATTTPTYWYRLMQPWVCLGILHHAADEPWPTSTRRQVLVDLAFGVEDWVSDAALFALVTVAYREPERRDEVRDLVRSRLDAAAAADRWVSIRASLAELMLVTPGCRAEDRAAARAAAPKDHPQSAGRPRLRWWRRRHR